MKGKATVEITLGEAGNGIGQTEYDAIRRKICFAIADCMKEGKR